MGLDGNQYWRYRNGEPYYSESVVANTTYFNLWDANNGQGHGYTGTFVKTVYDPSPVGFRVPRLAEFEKINNGNNGKEAFTPLTGVLNHDNFTVKYKGTNGYYWSSEKKIGPGNFGGEEVYTGYYGLFALARGSQKDLVLKKMSILYMIPNVPEYGMGRQRNLYQGIT